MIRAFQWDLARQVERLDWLLDQLPRYASWGYQELYLHLEDAVDYPSLPGVARQDAYSWRQFTQLVNTAESHGIKVVPIANLLGHTQYLIKTEAWRDLNELRAPDGTALDVGQICPNHPQAIEVAERLVSDLAPLCSAGKIHFGLDESFHLGKHPESRREIAKQGLGAYFAAWVNRLHQLAATHNLEAAIWGDMLIMLPGAIPLLPRGLSVFDWCYHAFRRNPRFELYNFAEYDLAPALKKHGIHYWGCPMNGAFRHEPLPVFGERIANAVSWWDRCQRTQAAGFLVSSWEANHLTPEMTNVVDAAIAGLWLEGDACDTSTLLQRGFQRVHQNTPARSAAQARLALACDERAFASYAQAERHRYWDSAHSDEGPARAGADMRFFQRSYSRQLDEPFKRSIGWRLYLAQREFFVKKSSDQILKARRLWSRQKTPRLEALLQGLEAASQTFSAQLDLGAQAAKSLHELTRKRNFPNANSQIIESDRRKLAGWKKWLSSVMKDAENLKLASPLAGRWQLCLTVHATRPAANLVVIQQQNESGDWHDLRLRHTIEFRSGSARPRSKAKRTWSVPIEDPDLPLRIGLRGVGEVAISQVRLTDGISTRTDRTLKPATRKKLGSIPKSAGWSHLDWTTNADQLDLSF
jgi:hypothetical protein